MDPNSIMPPEWPPSLRAEPAGQLFAQCEWLLFTHQCGAAGTRGNVFGMSCWFGCFGLWIDIVFPRFPTVNGRNLANYLGSIRFLVNHGINYLSLHWWMPEFWSNQDVCSSVRKPVRMWLNITRLRCWWYLHHYMWQCLRRHWKFWWA